MLNPLKKTQQTMPPQINQQNSSLEEEIYFWEPILKKDEDK